MLVLALFSLLSFTNDWVSYTAQDGNFKIFVPTAMEVQYDTINANIGTIFTQNYYCRAATDTTETLYTISYLDYPEFTIHEDSSDLVEMYFNATVESTVKELNGELVYASSDATAGHPTHLWKIFYDEQQKIAKFKSIIIDNHIYILRVSSFNISDSEKGTQRFLDSFRYMK